MSAHPSIVPFQFFATADGYLAVACAKEKFFSALAEGIELPGLADDPRFRTFSDRHQNRDLLLPILSERLRERPTAEWLERLQGTVPCAPVRDLAQALQIEDLTEREMLAAYEHPALGPVRAVGLPLHVADYRPSYAAGPALGADTPLLLTELGIDEEERQRLEAGGAFGSG
jgi:crotonobetainyl-CoA:carnitine CoA-transferase CaiB-like acyl-CoA transferase